MFGVNDNEWWRLEVSHTQYGKSWFSRGEGGLLCSRDHMWFGRLASGGHCLQVRLDANKQWIIMQVK